MRVFVAGAAGFIGRAACRALAAAGHEVTGLARSAEKAAVLEREGARAILGSLDEPESFLGKAGSSEAVVHLAATWFDGRETAEQAKRINEQIAGWTRSLARLALQARSRILVLGSTSCMYGDRGGAVTSEEAPHRPDGYGRILEASHRALAEICGREPLPTSTILPGWVYGEGSWLPDMLRQIRGGRTSYLIDGGEYRLGYVHVDDVGEAFRLAVEKAEAASAFNLADDDPVTVREFVEAAARLLGAQLPRGVSREEALRERGEVSVEALVSSARLDTSAAKKRLGWRPRYPSIREGLPGVIRAAGA
jgi:nucleoside-diphosphate-sugar epimerase